jgi:serine/threonine-protein kinase
MERVVAIKVLREVYSTDPKFVTRFQREAKAASSLQHPNIVQVYDYGQSDGNYFIVMELIEGTDLRRYLRSRGVLAIDRAIIIAHDVALGLGAAHRRSIVHRDVKPQNVLVGRDGSIKLTDFGIASVYKDINDERLTTTGMTLGTVQYYAPEQAQGEIVSPAADVYALGIVMYEMLTGRTPFDGDTPVAVAMQHIQDIPIPPSQINPSIPPALEEIIMRCLEKVPEMRFRDGSTLARALELLGEEELASGIPPQSSVSSLITPPPVSGGAYGQIPQRPVGGPMLNNNPASNPGNTRGGMPTQISNSGTNRMGGGYAPYNQVGQSGIQEQNTYIQPAETVYPQAGMLGNGADYQQMPYNQQDYNGGGIAGSTLPFQRGALAPPAPNETRFANIVTALIVVAALLLLGFSIFLAAQLGFLHMPGSTPTVTPTVAAQWVTVPDLSGMTLTQAQAAAAKVNLQIQVQGTSDGIVANQVPEPGATELGGHSILIKMKAAPIKVPDNLVNTSLGSVEAVLKSGNIQYTIQDNGPDPTKGDNIVVQTDPVAGTQLQTNQKVTLYVANYISGTPTIAPPVVPTPTTAPTATPNAAATTSAAATAAAATAAAATPTATPTSKATRVAQTATAAAAATSAAAAATAAAATAAAANPAATAAAANQTATAVAGG